MNAWRCIQRGIATVLGMRTLIRSLILSVCFVVAGWAAAGGNLEVRNSANTVQIAHQSFNLITTTSTNFTFIIKNSDPSNELSAVTFSFDQLVNCAPDPITLVDPSLNALEERTVVVNIVPGTGNFSFRVNVSSSDVTAPTLSPYQFTVGTVSAPEITVKRDTVTIADAGSETLTGTVATQAKAFRYQIINDGNQTLNLTSMAASVPVNVGISFTPTTGTFPPTVTTLAPYASIFIDVMVTATAPGAWSATLTIVSNDGDEATFNWEISGTAATPAGDITISSGSVIASGGQLALYGIHRTNPTNVNLTLRNVGNLNLTVSSITTGTPVNCTLGAPVPSTALPATLTVPAGVSPSMTVSVPVTPSATNWSFQIIIANTDPDIAEATYVVNVKGTIAPAKSSNSSGCGIGGSAGLLLAMLGLSGLALGSRRRSL